MALQYIVWNGPMPTTSPIASVALGAAGAVKTMLQIVPAQQIRPIEWGVSFNGSAAATPGVCELIDTSTIAGTVTAYAQADVMPYTDPGSTPTNSSGSSGVPLNLGTALSGYTCTSEGVITATRVADTQFVAPTNQYLKQFPLSREFQVPLGHVLRIRTSGYVVTNFMYCYILFEV